jgi:hypothetical protein
MRRPSLPVGPENQPFNISQANQDAYRRHVDSANVAVMRAAGEKLWVLFRVSVRLSVAPLSTRSLR